LCNFFYFAEISLKCGGKEQNPPACGRIYSFQNVGGAPPF
jgi:hypothetical protein